MHKVAAGRQSFVFLREGSYFYVDKTALLADWYESGDQVTLITRPRRFGKTLTLDMVRCFFSHTFSNREDLFAGLAISDHPRMMKLQGTLPVVFLSFANEHPTSLCDLIWMLVMKMAMLFEEFRYLTNGSLLSPQEKEQFEAMCSIPSILPVPRLPDGTENSAYTLLMMRLQNALMLLSTWLYRYHHKKVMILIDEYDTPLQSAYIHHFWNDALSVLRGLYVHTFETNPALDRALLTGITCIARASLFPYLNAIHISSVLSQSYSTALGFTQEEVSHILREYDLEDRKEDILHWYDGFSFGLSSHILSPWSVCMFLREAGHPVRPFWTQSGGMQLIDHLMRTGQPALVRDLRNLLLGLPVFCALSEEIVFPSLEENPDAIWSLLLASGYVRLASREALCLNSEMSAITLTNEEIRASFVQLAQQWLIADGHNYALDFADAVSAHDIKIMQKVMQHIVSTCASRFDLGTKPAKASHRMQPEKYFQGLVTGLTAGLMGRFIIHSNDESGEGCYDLSLVSRSQPSCVAIFEFKVFDRQKDKSITDTAMRALHQIRDKHYQDRFLQEGHTPDQIYCYGIGFQGKHVHITI
ncbi:MAG: AAA family ATPase [Clostridia bacterium]|nr:AAA family ATPase [Clostridia bacterium]